MTVKELIEELKRHPEDLDVLVTTDNYNSDITELYIREEAERKYLLIWC